jgi:putative membrane-bound dehydrogenase-like protein
MSRGLVFVLPFLLTVVPSTFAGAGLPMVPDGFKVEVVLQAPDIEAPTALCVAPNGDVYFAEDPMDMCGPPTKNIDKIWLLKGGDPGQKILFADKMWAVMGLEIVRDKLYVVHAPHVTVFTLDAEGKAASREDLFTDLGPPVAGVPSFNDHIPSGIRMGMDGWLYVSIGDKGIPKMARKELDQGSVHVAEGRWRHSKEGHHISLEGGGVIRFRPDGSGLEVFASGTRNHLDVPMDEHDRIFVRDNTDDGLGWWTRLMYLPHGAFMGYPWAYTRHANETLPMIRDFGGGAPCGGWVYCDDGLPETYRGRIFHCEWGQGKVYAVRLAPNGAGFKFVDQITFMDPGKAVKDFRPFTLRPTADGRGFYVTDWGFGGWLTDKKLGRLWKVTYTRDDVKPALRGSDADTVEQLIKALDHPAHSERLRAQRELIARLRKHGDGSLLAKLHDAFESRMSGKVDSKPPALCHLIWTAYLGGRDNADLRQQAFALVQAMRSRMVKTVVWDWCYEAGRLLTNADLKLPEHAPTGADDFASTLRLQAAIAMQTNPSLQAVNRFPYECFNKETEPVILYSLIRAAKRAGGNGAWERHALMVAKPDMPLSLKARQALLLAFTDEFDVRAVKALTNLAVPDAPIRKQIVETLARVYKDRKPYAGTWWGTQPAGRNPPAREVTWEGTPLVRDAILTALTDPDDSVRKAAVAALIEMKDPDTLEPIVKHYAAEKETSTRADLVRALASIDSPRAIDFLASVLHERNNPEAVRLATIAGLQRADSAAAAKALAEAAAVGPATVQAQALQALGSMKNGDLTPVATEGLKSASPAVRQAAVGALAARGGRSASLLLPLLEDSATDVRIATARALGVLKDSLAVPALVRSAGDEATQFDAITALTHMPDRRALTAYLTGLTSKNVDLRKSSAAALTAVREQVLPDLEQLIRRNEIHAELLPELRNVYAAFIPVLDWKLIGPFPDDHKVHPPEKELNFGATYRSLDQDVRWKSKRGDGKKHGLVRLGPLYRPNDNVIAYGYAEVASDLDRDALLLIGSDDTLAVWVNGKKVHEFDGSRGWSFDEEKAKVHLNKGINRLLIRCGNFAGPWEFSVAVSGDVSRYSFLQGESQKFDLETFRVYARKNAGDPGRGKKLFQDVKGLACIKCHAVGAEGGRVGPDLAGIGLKYKREDLMTSVLEPSKTIAQGYETIVLTLANGKTLTGVFKGESADAINLADAEGKAATIAKKDIDTRFFSPVSTMPNGLSDGMTLQDFADVIAFLEAQREQPAAAKK